MPKIVVSGATLRCNQGTTPGQFAVLPANLSTAGERPTATVMDFAPTVNIGTFAMCRSPANPQVAAATSAAMGVLTPMPCVPATASPWTPGSPAVKLNGLPVLTDDSTCLCVWGGTIEVTDPGTAHVSTD